MSRPSSYGYDLMDRVLSVTTTQGTINYTYFANSLRKTLTVTGQAMVRYTNYNNLNQLTNLTQAAGTSNNNIAQSVTIAYDNLNRRIKTLLPNGSSESYGYTCRGCRRYGSWRICWV